MLLTSVAPERASLISKNFIVVQRFLVFSRSVRGLLDAFFLFFFRSILVKIDFEGWQQGIYSRSIFRQFTERVSNLWNIRYQ